MQTKLAIITTEFLHDFVDRSMKEIGLDVEYEQYLYRTFAELPDLYRSIPSDIKGIVISGAFAQQVVLQSFPDTPRSVRAFNTDDAGIYKLFLQLMQDRNLDLSRIYADLLDVIGIPIEDYLFQPQKATFSDLVDRSIGAMPLERLMEMEQYCIRKHLALWKEKRIDVSITRFSSIVQRLQEEGVPVHFAYPSLEYLKSTCQSAIQDVQIRQMQQNLLAVVTVTIQDAGITSHLSGEERVMYLREALHRYSSRHLLDFVLRPIPLGFEVFTSRKAVSFLTDNFTSCQLQEYFGENMPFGISVGYGIGNNVYQARLNAIDANREARLHPASSCLINETDDMVMLRGARRMVVSRDFSPHVEQAAASSGLSTLTVQKIFSVAQDMEQSRITSQELANRLSITQRSANRFLSALRQAGVAKVISGKRGTTKGRPERVYQIQLV